LTAAPCFAYTVFRMRKTIATKPTKGAPRTRHRAAPRQTETLRRGTFRYTAFFEPAEEGGYVVTIPALNGLVTEGDSLKDARAMAEDAIRCYIEGCLQDGEDIPIERDDAVTARIAVRLAKA
jgi:predicted RNase H-like HicB family nuclease